MNTITARLLRLPALTEVVGSDLSGSFNRRIQLARNDVGSGSLDLLNDDPTLALVQDNDYVELSVNGTPVGGFIVKEIGAKLLDSGEESDEVTTLAGPGQMLVLEWARTYPARGIGALPEANIRLFDWTAPEFVIDANWDPATEVVTVLEAQGGDWPTQPFGEGFPGDSGAYMIWDETGNTSGVGVDGGSCYARKEVTLTGGRYGFFGLIDNQGQVYVDGQSIMEISYLDGYHKVTAAFVELSSGAHTIAIHGNNIDNENPAGIALAVYVVDANNTPTTLVAITDSSWDLYGYAPSPPGMTVGEALHIWTDEAQDRGAITFLTPTFTTSDDSNSDAWPEVADLSTRTWGDGLTFLGELVNRYVDSRVTPDFDWHVWAKGAGGTATGIELDEGVNLSSLRSRSQTTRSTVIAVKWAGASTSVATGSGLRIEGFLEAGHAPSAVEAARIAQARLELEEVRKTQLSATVEPVGGDVPGVDFLPLDTVVLNGVEEEVTSITISEDDVGEAIFDVSFRDLLASQEERFDIWLKKMANGTGRGTYQEAAPAEVFRPAVVTAPATVVPIPIVFDRDAGVSVSESKPWTVDRPCRISEIQVDIPGGEDADVDLLLDGVVVASVSVTTTSYQNAGISIPADKGQVLTVDCPDTGFDMVVTVRLMAV